MIISIVDLLFFAWSLIMMLKFPPFIKNGTLGLILGGAVTIATFFILWQFKNNPKTIPDFSQIPPFEELPNPIKARKIFWAIQIIFAHIWLYYMWSHDWWHMSNAYWIAMYLYWWFSGYVFYHWRRWA